MLKNNKLNRIAMAVALSVGMSTAAMAQETASAMSGIITGPQGQPASGTEITIIHVPSGSVKTAVVGESGRFTARGLRVGGPYQVIIDSDQFEDTIVNDVNLTLGETYDLTVALEAEQDIESIVITGSQLRSMAYGENGPSANFGLEQLENAPAINRNITDIIRIDPRIYVDESNGDQNGIQCAGKNPRFNSFTLDGVRMNDSFGLNGNGYPTERMPFSFDAIEQVAVELAPFDVQYGGFTACNINAVTKSGTNDVHGGFFADYTSDDLRGDSLEGDDIRLGNYSEKRYGFNVGFPILEDKVFAFVAYEKLEGANLFDRGPTGSGAVEEIQVSQAELDEIVSIAQSLYQYDPGGIPSSLDNEDEKLLVKIDWNINDDHRFAFTYNYNDGNNFTESDGDLNEFEFLNHLYERGAELNSYVGSLYSNWTDKFSTEIRLGYLDLDNRQISIGGTDFGEIRVELNDRPGLGDVDVYLGGDDSRQSNKLQYDLLNIILRGTYFMDNGHTLTFGYEREDLDVFNLFVQHSETEIRFDGIENFRNGFADAIYYNNAPSNNPQDAAADWGYALNTVYFQDQFDLTDDLTVKAGLRYDWYTTSDEPGENPQFVQDYGFSNSQNLDGEGLLQPRLQVTYLLDESTTITGGLGLYSGGNPNVWLSNTFSANNVLQFGQRGRSFGYTDGTRSLFDDDVVYVAVEDGAPNGPGYGIPSELFNAVAGGVGDNFELNYLDPNFELPSEWKFSLGVTHITDNDFIISGDILVSRTQDAAIVLRGDLEQTGTNPDGYPQYDSVREPSFVLTNSTEDATSYTISTAVQKAYDNGFDWMVGYAYSDAEDVQPMTSSVAFSNYVNRAFFDPQEQIASRSNYNIEHRFTAQLNYVQEFFSGYETRFSMFASAQSGEPFSITFDGTIDPYGFTPFLDFEPNVLRPGTERNGEDGSWWTKADIRVSQQLPGFTKDHRAEAFFVIDNFTNFLNDDWGILEQVNFPNNVEEGSPRNESRVGDASLYEIRVGIRYVF